MVWQKVNICISRAISNFPTKSWLYYDHGRLPKDASYIQQAHLTCPCLKTERRAPSDHERENWIIHIVYSHTFPSQTKFTRRAVHNSVYPGDSGHSAEIPAQMSLREEGRKPNPRISLLSRDVEAQLGMLGSTGKHHLKTYRVWAFLRIFGKIQESCHRFSQLQPCIVVSTSKQDTGVSLLGLAISEVPLMLKSLYRRLASFVISF